MKKILLILVGLLILFIGLTYWSVSSTDKAFTTCKILGYEDADSIDFKKHDSVLVATSTLYEANAIKVLMQGEQYRKAWATPIQAPIVFLDTLFGGMKIIEQGGGKQTHSLELESKNGIRYTLRSITKNPAPLIPELAKTLGLENIVVDGISAQHPYAALVVAKLAQAVNILHTNPKIVFIPKQKQLDTLNEKFGNRLFLLEYETEGEKNWIKMPDVIEIMDTEALQKFKLKHGNKVNIDQPALVRARLFDFLIGDWDRHAKQWGWVVRKEKDTYSAIPLPGDRDNAFFHLEGLIPTLISNKKILPGLQPFENEIEYMPGLVMPFDIYFLSTAPRHIFLEEAERLQELLTDDVIDQSFEVWPKEIYDLDGEAIFEKIRHRRDSLGSYARKFRDVLDDKALLQEPLKGSEDLDLPEGLLKCFDCANTSKVELTTNK